MTATSAIGNTSGVGNLTIQDFMRVLMTQLTYQDPLKPMDNQEFLAQIAQFTSLAQTQAMNSNLEILVSNQAAQQSVGLIGRTVNIATDAGPQTGTVTSIDLTGVLPNLTITTATGILNNISFSQITSIR